MRKEQFKGFVKLSLAHHPLCWQFKAHTIRIGGIVLCLGCTGFYSGILIGTFIVIFGRLFQFEWLVLVSIATILAFPTILRLLKIPFFASTNKILRLLYRWLLGIGVSIGLVSIFKAPHLIIGLIQFVLGFGLYLGIALNRMRSKEMWTECQDCSYSISLECPGFAPFYLRKEPKEEIKQ
ncbi:MAG: DUF2085 domain-containing protein [Promethearchaeota archaeon]